MRTLRITDEAGKGLQVTALGDTPFAFNCFPYSIKDLDKAMHTHELQHTQQTTVCIDVTQRGVGGDTPGSATLRDPYIMHKGTTYTHRFVLEPLG